VPLGKARLGRIMSGGAIIESGNISRHRGNSQQAWACYGLRSRRQNPLAGLSDPNSCHLKDAIFIIDALTSRHHQAATHSFPSLQDGAGRFD
jgi:hypothetical protein